MLFDADGRLVITVSENNIRTDYVRTNNGRLQLKNNSDGLWYDLVLQNDPETGFPVLGVSDSGVS